MLFHGKSSVCVPQTLTKLLLFTRWGIASAPAVTVRSVAAVAILQWTEHAFPRILRIAPLENVRHQRAASVRSTCHLCTEDTTVIPEACRVHLQRADTRISRLENAKLLPKNTAKLSEVLGSLHQSPYSRYQQLQSWAARCRNILQHGV